MVAFDVDAMVEHVTDGDTVRLTIRLGSLKELFCGGDRDLGWDLHVRGDVLYLEREPVRLAHVNAPEHGTEAGEEATAFVRQLLPEGAIVHLHSLGYDKWRRTLGDVSSVGVDVAQMVIQSGHGTPYEGGKR